VGSSIVKTNRAAGPCSGGVVWAAADPGSDDRLSFVGLAGVGVSALSRASASLMTCVASSTPARTETQPTANCSGARWTIGAAPGGDHRFGRRRRW